MKTDDKQIGTPLRVYRDTKANIEALALVDWEGGLAYATDIDAIGVYGGASWAWTAVTAGKTLTVQNSLTLAAAGEGYTLTIPATGTAALRSDKLSVFAATTSAELAGVISDETGSGALVFGTSPTFTTQITVPLIIAPSTSLALRPTTNATTAIQLQNAAGTSVLNVDTTNGRVGIGTTGPTQKLHVYGSTNGEVTFQTENANTAGVSGAAVQNFVSGSTVGQFVATNESYNNISNYGVTASSLQIINRSGPISFKAGGYKDVNEWMRITSTGNVGIGTTSPATLLHALKSDAVTVAVTNVATLGHNSTGTPAAGFGGGLVMNLESSTTEAQTAAALNWLWNDATHATRKADLVAYAYDTAARELWRGRGAGAAPAIGFLGAAPSARLAHVADPAGGATVDAEARTAINSILASLETFGFHATS